MKNKYLISILKNSNTGLLFSAIIIFLVLALATDNFLTPLSLFTMGRTAALFIFIALAQTIALVKGDMNLSVGAIGGLATVAVGYCLEIRGFPGWITVIIALTIGIIAGLINGLMVAKLGINSFIVTLGTLFFYTGLVFGFTKGFPYNDIPKTYLYIGRAELLGIPLLIYIAVAVLVIVFLFFKYAIAGRRMLAVGESITVAKFSGINTDNITILSHVLSGFIASVAGVLYVSRIGSANPATGQDWLIISFAVAIIGGTALSGGSLSPFGLFIAAVIMVMIKNGLVSFKVNIYWEQAFLGLIILIAVMVDRLRMYYQKKSLI